MTPAYGRVQRALLALLADHGRWTLRALAARVYGVDEPAVTRKQVETVRHSLNRLRYEGKVVMLGYHLFDRTRASYTTPEGERRSKAEWDERMNEIARMHSPKSR
jgi:hypothetical protein